MSFCAKKDTFTAGSAFTVQTDIGAELQLARHLSGLPDSSIFKRIGWNYYDSSFHPCLNCLVYGWDEASSNSNGRGLCTQHIGNGIGNGIEKGQRKREVVLSKPPRNIVEEFVDYYSSWMFDCQSLLQIRQNWLNQEKEVLNMKEHYEKRVEHEYLQDRYGIVVDL